MKVRIGFEVRLDRLQGHLVIGGSQLPEVVCQEHARIQVTVLKARSLISDEEATELVASIALSPLPNTWIQVTEAMVLQVIEERAKPYFDYVAIKAEG